MVGAITVADMTFLEVSFPFHYFFCVHGKGGDLLIPVEKTQSIKDSAGLPPLPAHLLYYLTHTISDYSIPVLVFLLIL